MSMSKVRAYTPVRILVAKPLKACPHLFPKQDNLYPETETLYAETGYFVSVFGNKIACFGIRSFCYRIQIILFPDTNLPFLTMKSPETATKYPVSETSVDRP